MIIGSRYHGPPGSGNGGYTAGLIAAELGGDAIEVTLRKPPPLETELSLSHEPDGGVVVHDPSGERVAEAKRTVIASDEVVPAVSFATAVEASRTYQGFVRHPFPTCFVCGPQREPDDGLRVFPGRLADGRTRHRSSHRSTRHQCSSGRCSTVRADGRCLRRSAPTSWAGSRLVSTRSRHRATSV